MPDEAAQRSRATMWDVVRFAEHHRYRAIVVENVVDAARWVMWPAWLHAMTLLGYQHRVVYLNSMHAPAVMAPRAPQSRDLVYVVFWRTGQRAPQLDVWPRGWCERCGRDVEAVQSWKRPDRKRAASGGATPAPSLPASWHHSWHETEGSAGHSGYRRGSARGC